MGETEVTYELWNAVHTWATASGSETCQTSGEACYTFDNAGLQGGAFNASYNFIPAPSGTNKHPVTTINWYDAIKFSKCL